MTEHLDNTYNSLIFQQGREGILAESNALEEALQCLRYEGKVNIGKNLNTVDTKLKELNGKVLPHIAMEQTVFSYLSVHVPKLDPLMKLLKAEHEEIKVGLEVLEFLLKEIMQERHETKRNQDIEKLKDKGTYLIYLLRNHLRAESDSVYPVIQNELHEEERRELWSRLLKLN